MVMPAGCVRVDGSPPLCLVCVWLLRPSTSSTTPSSPLLSAYSWTLPAQVVSRSSGQYVGYLAMVSAPSLKPASSRL